MRYYLRGPEDEERVIDLVETRQPSPETVEFTVLIRDDGGAVTRRSIRVRHLAGQLFTSWDGIRWERAAREELPRQIVAIDRTYEVYRGFKPSGVGAAAAGDLITQMPGRVVKVAVQAGQAVKKGETLAILEAMKMENEIKSPLDGTVKVVHVREGDTLEQGRLMMELEA